MVSFARPTMTELLTRVAGDIASRTEGHAFVRRTVEAALGFACAGIAYTLHGHLDWVRRQLFPHTADVEALSEWGDWLELPRKAGARAQGIIATVGIGSVPTSALYSDAAGNLYRVLSYAGAGSYIVRAVEHGQAQNLGLGETLSLVSPVPEVEPTATVSSALSGGADLEEVEDYRPRVIAALRRPAFTGAPGDYEHIALSREGVTRAWERDRRMGAGTVSVAFVMDQRFDPIPLPDDVADVQAAIDLVRPADMIAVYVSAPIRDALHLTVSARGTMVESEVADAVRAFLRSDASLELPISRSLLDEAISSVPGEVSHTITGITAESRGVTRTIALDAGEIAPVTWGLFTLGSLTLTVVP